MKDKASMNEKERLRYPLVDITRGFAVFLMIIFHLSYDLNAFHFIRVNFQSNLFWWTFPRVIVFLFLYAMGQSLALVHKESIILKKVWRRFLKIGFLALGISLFTFYAFPHNWIYFGTLHCIALCSLLALPFINRPKIAFLTALLLLLPPLFGFNWPFPKLHHSSMDYIPVLPWLGVVLLGEVSVSLKLHSFLPPKLPLFSPLLKWFGRHSLKIYILHQPILFGLVKLASLVVIR